MVRGNIFFSAKKPGCDTTSVYCLLVPEPECLFAWPRLKVGGDKISFGFCFVDIPVGFIHALLFFSIVF